MIFHTHLVSCKHSIFTPAKKVYSFPSYGTYKLGRLISDVYIYVDMCPHFDGRQFGMYRYIHTYIHTYIPTFVHAFVHTYILTYIYSYLCIQSSLMFTGQLAGWQR
jgi:hypothetical protein